MRFASCDEAGSGRSEHVARGLDVLGRGVELGDASVEIAKLVVGAMIISESSSARRDCAALASSSIVS